MDRLWVHISAGFGLLSAVAIGAVFAHPWLEVSPWVLVLVLSVVGAALVLATRRALAPLSQITEVIERIAAGDINQRPLTEPGSQEVERLRLATNRMIGRLHAISNQARELADGNIGVREVEELVVRSQRLADADQPVKADAGDLERSFTELINQRRRLTIQARMISQDRLQSPLLDQRVPGELGDTFHNMVQYLRAIAQRATGISHGDLTHAAQGDGELANAFNQMVGWLRGLVEQISATALHISTAAEQILAVLREQESAANHQAASVEETQRTMESLLASAKKIAENAQHVFKSAEKTQGSNRSVAERISELKLHTARISEILEGIKRIADRSDLLALNASLEGMRAGEAGKGFTLVAAEMRRLAENIKGSVGDIKTLVTDIGESSAATAQATDEGTRMSENTTDNALKITLITQQQKSGTEQVTQSMDDLSELINQGVAGTRQVTIAAVELVDLAESLRELVDQFQLAGHPGSTGPYPSVDARARRRKSGGFGAATPTNPSLRVPGRVSGDLPRRDTPLPSGREGSAMTPTRRPSGAPAAGASRAPRPEDGDADAEGVRAHSAIPMDSGADQPTVEFSTQFSPHEQHAVARQMLQGARADAAATKPAATGRDEAPEIAALAALEASASALGDGASDIDADLDALEREIDRSSATRRDIAPEGAEES